MTINIDMPTNATNGDALNYALRALFPKVIFIHGQNIKDRTHFIVTSEEWLNAPYKEGGAE